MDSLEVSVHSLESSVHFGTGCWRLNHLLNVGDSINYRGEGGGQTVWRHNGDSAHFGTSSQLASRSFNTLPPLPPLPPTKA